MLLKSIGDGLLTFNPIYKIWYLNTNAYYAKCFSDVNSALNVDVYTDVFLFDDQSVGF